MISQEYLKTILSYDPSTGIFIRLVRTGTNTKIGVIAGGINTVGYWTISVLGRRFLAHRLAWLWMTGGWPSCQIDHTDMDRSNNRWDNLREADHSENKANRPATGNNTSGLKWVSWDESKKKWKWAVGFRGKTIQGRSECRAAAYLTAVVVADKLHGEFARIA